MNKVLLQIWEESENGNTIPDGCSIHLDIEHRNIYLKSIYSKRTEDSVPVNYEASIGLPVEIYVNDVIFAIILRDKSIRLQEYEMNNLLNLKEIEIAQ